MTVAISLCRSDNASLVVEAGPCGSTANPLCALGTMHHLPIISDKGDLVAATRLVELGYPAVHDVLPVLFTWIRDGNWPVAQIIAPFLASIGYAAVPEIWKILRSDDLIWKCWCISRVIAELPPDVAVEFAPELHRLATSPVKPEQYEALDEVASDALEHLIAQRTAQ
jgi:hypothetical protein